MSFEDDLGARLARLEAEHRLRRRPDDVPEADGLVDFASNDYLGLGKLRRTLSAPGSARASRLVRGECGEVRALERSVASWLGVEAALVFSSGYAANVGLVSALASRGDLIVSDALNHASLIDGCRLSRAEVTIVPHLGLDVSRETLLRHRATGSGRRWLLTESYFGMDGDGPDLAQLRALADEADAGLLVDEAHALGVVGPGGRGRLAEAGVRADAVMGTFGKGLGGSGAFVAGSGRLIEWLWNRARSFVFSTGTSPIAALATRFAFEEALERGDPLRAALGERVHAARDGLRRLGLTALGTGAVVPILCPTEKDATSAQALARNAGLHVSAIRPPTASPRVRVAVHADHSEAEIHRFLDVADSAREHWVGRA